jgi:toxin ParE1/3/4
MVKIVWTEIAQSDLKDIYDFILRDSGKYAWIISSKIYQEVQVLMTNPFIGRIVPEFGNKKLREIISGKYRIIYRVVDDYRVDILRIYHSARILGKGGFGKDDLR